MLEEGIVSALTTNSTFTALVGTRIYPVDGVRNQETFPYVTYRNGPSPATEYYCDGKQILHKSIQFDVWAQKYSDARNIANAIDGVLSGYAGTLPDGTRVIFATAVNEIDNFDVDARAKRSIVEYNFQYVE